jgi:RNA polymerase sigma-54 factor
LIHLDSLALEQRIETEMYDNPALEEVVAADGELGEKFSKDSVQDFQNWEEYGYDDIPDYKTEYCNYLSTDKMPDRQLADPVDFRADLKKQYRFRDASPDWLMMADFIIDSIDERGFLSQDLDSLAVEISFKNKIWVEPGELEKVLLTVQDLDPAGVASRDIREYFLIQLRGMDSSIPEVAQSVFLLEYYYAEVCSANLERICRHAKMEMNKIKNVLKMLASLKTRPVAGYPAGLEAPETVTPDFLITTEGEELLVSLTRQRSATLQISHSWVESVRNLEQDKSAEKATKQYMRSKLNSAQWFINALRQRETNMIHVMNAMVRFQLPFFQSGDHMLLKPMVLKNIADIVGLDISTVSRITSNKYAETPFGTLLLKDLFTEGLTDKEGNSVSNEVIRTRVEDLIGKEDKKNPFTDQKLADILSDEGYNVARRTIAKYRDQLNIPVAQVRALRLSLK